MLDSRSYAGMIRIRFKGPAQRHLSIVRCPPRNKAMMRRRMTEVNAPPIFWSLLGQPHVFTIDGFAGRRYSVEEVL